MNRLPLALAPAALVLLALSACGGRDAAAPVAAPAPALIPTQRLTLEKSGQGLVESRPAGIYCDGVCAFDFDQDTRVTLTASPRSGAQFDGWGGACSGSGSCEVVMSTARTVTATFIVLPPPTPVAREFELTVTRTDGGQISSSPAGIACGATCAHPFTEGSRVALSATPDPGFFFASWSGDCSGSAACSVSMSRARAVSAAFAPAAPVGQWLKGDLHVHTDHSSDGSGPRQGLDQRGPGNVSVADQIGQGVLAGLDWMPLTDHRTFDQHYDPLWESADLLLLTGEEANGSPHANPIGAVDMIVQGGDTPGRPGWAKLQTSIWDAHSQGAVWSHNHPDDGHLNEDDTPNERANALGYDTMEAWNKASNIVRELAYAENRWNAGYRFGIVGACDDHFRELWAVAGPGTPTTHAFSSELNERAVLQGLMAGRTIINARATTAPLVTLEADLQRDGIFEALAGDEVVAPAGTLGRLRLRVQQGAGTTISLYKNPGKSAGALETFMPVMPDETFTVDITADDTARWYYAEARGPGEVDAVDTATIDQPTETAQPDSGSDERRAITSPIFIGPVLVTPQPEMALPSAIGVDDGAQRVLGDVQQFSGFPDVAVSDGIAHVVAEQHSAGRTAVMYRRADAGTAIDLAPLSKAARFPKIVARGNLVWAAWQDERSSQVPHRGAILLRQSLDGGSTWLPEVTLRSIAGRAEKPDLALMPDGKPVVVWQEISAANPFDVMAQIVGSDVAPVNISRAGKTIMAANASDTRSSRYPASVWPSVAVHEDGRIAVAFQDNRTDPDALWTGSVITGEDNATEVDNWQIMVSTRPVTGAFSAPVGFGNDQRADRHPAVGFTTTGALLAVWDSKTLNASGANLSVRSALSADNGITWSAASDPAPFAHDAGAMSQYPKLGTNPDGTLRAVWYDSRAADWRWRVMTAVFDGAAWNDGTLLLSPGINTWPATDAGQIVFASTRNAQRVQRDRTQQVFLLP